MANIPVTVIYKGQGFKQVQSDAKQVDRDLKRASRERMRALRLQSRHERAVTQELKQQIREQRKLNQLTNKLNRDLEKQQKTRRDKLRTGAGAAATAAGVGAAFAVDAVKAADAARVTESAFNNLSGGLANAEENMAAMQRATRGLISEQQQQAIANQLMGMQIANSSEELEKVVGVSRRLGRAFRGLGAEDAANEFAIMMSNMSVERLDSFGIGSGKVRERIKELMATTEGMTREQAFFQATMEEAEKTLARLGPELDTPTQGAEKLKAQFENLKVELGELLVTGGDGGVLGWLTNLTTRLIEGAQAWQGFFKNVGLAGDALGNLDISPDFSELGNVGREAGEFLAQGLFGGFDDLARGEGLLGVLTGDIEGARQTFEDVADEGTDVVTALTKMLFGAEETGEAFTEAGEAMKEAEQAQQAVATAFDTSTVAAEDNSEAMKEAAEIMDRLNEKRREFAGSLIDIDQKAQEETTDAWSEYFDKEQAEWDDHQAKIKDIRRKGAADLAKVDKDLQKDLKKLGRDLGSDQAKVNRDEARRIAEIQRRSATEQKQESKRKQVDALADERLFNFEMKQLAAEGNAAQIQEALERREIEGQIAQEKAQVEGQIEDDKMAEEIRRVRQSAEERRGELRVEAAERVQILKEEAEEERAARQEELEQQIADEEEGHATRLEELRTYRNDKLGEIQASKDEAIQALGEELVEMGELTQSELKELVPIAGKFGADAGKAFADGLSGGFERNKKISSLLGEAADFTAPGPRAGAGRSNTERIQRGGASGGFGARPNTLSGFQHGGSFTVGGSGGPDSQLVQFMATPGEQVSVSPQGGGGGNIVINATGAGGAQLAAILEQKVNEGLQEYTDTVLTEALA